MNINSLRVSWRIRLSTESGLLMDRDLILSIRVHGRDCGHGPAEDEDWGGSYVDVHTQLWECEVEDCPGGAAAFTECESCGGYGHTIAPVVDLNDSSKTRVSCSNPDCVGGLVGHHGFRLIYLCAYWGEWGADKHEYCTGGEESPEKHKDCGWHVTVPIRLGSET